MYAQFETQQFYKNMYDIKRDADEKEKNNSAKIE